MEEKQEKTPEDLAAIAYLDRLRNGEGESMPANLPRACVIYRFISEGPRHSFDNGDVCLLCFPWIGERYL